MMLQRLFWPNNKGFQSFFISKFHHGGFTQIQTTYELDYSLRMGQLIVYYSDYLILNIVMYFQKISYWNNEN